MSKPKSVKKTDSKPNTPEQKPDQKIQPKAESASEKKSELKPEPKPEKKPEKKLEKKPENKMEKTVEKSSSKSLAKLNLVLIFLIIIIVGGVIGYSVTQIKTMQQNIQQVAGEYEQSHKNYLQAEAQLDNLKADLVQQKSELQSQQSSLNKFTSEKRHQEWQREEINYLVNLANYAMTFSQDPKTAYALLNTADQAVKELNDPSALPLRQAIGKSLDQLNSAKQQDVTKLFVQLDNLSEQIAKLPLIGESPEFMPEAEAESNVEKSGQANANSNNQQELLESSTQASIQQSAWKKHLKQSWQQLKSLITVRNQSDALKPLVARQGGDYIFQYISLQLGQAQWGLLHRDNTVYQTSLKQAEHWVSRYFVATDPKTQQVLELFKILQAQDIGLEKISLQPTLTAVAAFDQQ